MMGVLVTGANGQLGFEIQRTVPDGIEVYAKGSKELDITNLASINKYLEQLKPQAVINCAAYTAVDKAEAEGEIAEAVNAQGPANLATLCREMKIPLVHISSDFVFDGSQSVPYKPQDQTNPVSIYGRSKLHGELAVQELMGDKASIIRTAWVYSASGNNFVKTMLRLMAEKEQLGVVTDQTGTPTWAKTLAKTCWQACQKLMSGQPGAIYHWSDAGVCSWYDFAVAIQEEALSLGLLQKSISIQPIPARSYPTPALRPPYSVLDKTDSYSALGMPQTHWRTNLRIMLKELIVNQPTVINR